MDSPSRPRLLIALPQSPFDPASGAARSVRTIGEMLVSGGFEVRCVGTTASEAGPRVQNVELSVLASARRVRSSSGGAIFEVSHRGIVHQLVDVGELGPWAWQPAHTTSYDELFDIALESFEPGVLLTYGGTRGDRARQDRARGSDCRVVLAVQNMNYTRHDYFRSVDQVLTPSLFISRQVWRDLEVGSMAIPTPLQLDDVIAPFRRPRSVTMVNPSMEKGVMFMATLIRQLTARHPEIPITVFESRGTGNLLVQAGLVGGFDLRQSTSLTIRSAVADPREIYADARILVVPSVVEEASGRVVAEAMINGIPTLVSDRGGLPENCGSGGRVLAFDEGFDANTRSPVSATMVEPWLQEIVTLTRDETAYQAARSRALSSSLRFHPQVVQAQYVDFFSQTAADLGAGARVGPCTENVGVPETRSCR